MKSSRGAKNFLAVEKQPDIRKHLNKRGLAYFNISPIIKFCQYSQKFVDKVVESGKIPHIANVEWDDCHAFINR